MRKVFQLLAKSVLIPLRVTAVTSGATQEFIFRNPRLGEDNINNIK